MRIPWTLCTLIVTLILDAPGLGIRPCTCLRHAHRHGMSYPAPNVGEGRLRVEDFTIKGTVTDYSRQRICSRICTQKTVGAHRLFIAQVCNAQCHAESKHCANSNDDDHRPLPSCVCLCLHLLVAFASKQQSTLCSSKLAKTHVCFQFLGNI